LGQGNWSIRKIFLYNGGYLITKGMLYGNILAIGMIVLQNQFQIFTLPQANYYVSVVPMAFPVTAIVLVDVCAFVMCFIALVLPSYMITRISPIKAIRFEKDKRDNSFRFIIILVVIISFIMRWVLDYSKWWLLLNIIVLMAWLIIRNHNQKKK